MTTVCESLLATVRASVRNFVQLSGKVTVQFTSNVAYTLAGSVLKMFPSLGTLVAKNEHGLNWRFQTVVQKTYKSILFKLEI